MKKRIITLTTAIAMIASMSGAAVMSASTVTAASTETLGDINGDSSVNLSDLVWFGKVLNGQYALSSYAVADLNVNNVVDYVDYLILQYYNVGLINTLPYTD